MESYRLFSCKMRNRWVSPVPAILAAAMLVLGAAPAGRAESPAAAAVRIENPYSEVNWASNVQYKANLHTHTTLSDGKATPSNAVGRYRKLGYAILSLTDHDTCPPPDPTWPWGSFGISPGLLGVAAVQGNEISGAHHIGSYFSDRGFAEAVPEAEVIAEIGRGGGLAVFFHPGRYDSSAEWYADMFRRYSHAIGMEVFNRSDRYPGDRALWDAVLTLLLPDRAVWGFSNDDMHDPDTELSFNWNVFILPDLSAASIRRAMENGVFFYVHAPKGHVGPAPPVIHAIEVMEQPGIIHVRASGHDCVAWISRGKEVHHGDTLNLAELPDVDGYVRAEVRGAAGTVVGTQQFRVSRPSSRNTIGKEAGQQ